MSQTQTGNELDRRTSPRTQSQQSQQPRQPHQPQQQSRQARITNNEPNSTLYIFNPNARTKPQSTTSPEIKSTLYIPNPKAKSRQIGQAQKPLALPAPESASTTALTVAKPQPKPKPVQNIHKNQNIQNIQKVQAVQTQTKTKTQTRTPVKPEISQAKKPSPVKRLATRFKKNGLGIIDSYFNAYYMYYEWKSDKQGRKPKDYLETVMQHPKGWGRNKSNADVYEKNSYDKYLAFLAFLAKLWGFICSLFKPAKKFFKSITDFFAVFGNSSKAAKNIGYIAQKAAGVILPVASVIFTVLAIMNINLYKPELELTFNGQNIGFVDSKETVGKVISQLENTVSTILNEPYEFTGDLSYRIVLAKDKTYISESDLYYLMHNSSQIQNEITTGYGFYIDDEFIIAVENENDIDIVLNEILEANSGDIDDGTIELANDIKIIENKYAKRDVVTQDELKDILTYLPENNNVPEDGESESKSESESESVYINIADNEVPLAAGNSLALDYSDYLDNPDYLEYLEEPAEASGDIAAVAAASSINLNPEVINTIPRGFLDAMDNNWRDAILTRLTRTSGSTTAGSIQFKKTKTESYTVEIPFEVKYVDSASYYVGTQTIQTNGANGENMITAEVTYIGDSEVSREIKDIETVRAPVTKVILVGTKQKPVTTPTGGFIRPVRGGYYSTYYSSGHRAIDIPLPYGSTVMAADGGTVIYTGNSGSYGKHIKIKHSDGYVTLYAHLSAISVNNGDSVYQGQKIGEIGSTGRSTGNHLHFEIIKNGVQVNPLSYFN